MADDSSFRSKISSFWEALFPSSEYFFIFIAVGIVPFGTTHLADQIRELYGANSQSESSIYKLLKETELLKLAPVVLLFSFAFLVYAFDRIVSFVGIALPPLPSFRGSTALYVNKNALERLWMLLPDNQNVAALESEARRSWQLLRERSLVFVV